MAAKDKNAEEGHRKPPKGGRVGGTLFPRLSLTEALEYAEKLARRTQGGPQAADMVLVGVFGTKNPRGKVRASALKQFGLLDGEEKGTYTASQLARDIDAAPQDERRPLWQRAFLRSKIFREMYETLQGDTVAKGRLRQVAMNGKVHGNTADLCVDLFIEGAVKTGLAMSASDDKITLTVSGATAVSAEPPVEKVEDEPPAEDVQPLPAPPAVAASPAVAAPPRLANRTDAIPPRTAPQLQLHVDSSSDPEKLRKQLELLREFGMI